ncbi:fasciclin domain-containing protein [Thalassobellus citreus]|uniref:fasciclin domain-containing protein n=1 Tax=Thalassobellus citreus TaxID=3367752 RepID=UPI0037BA57A0
MIKNIKNGIILILIVLAFNACTEEYVTDAGVSKAETELTAYDYLKTHKYHMFDSIVKVIDVLNLKDKVNASGTFFAPTDYGLNSFLSQKTFDLQVRFPDSTYTINSLINDPEATENYILQYAFKERITLTDATTDGKVYETLAGNEITIQKRVATDAVYTQYTDVPTYFLFYIKPNEIRRIRGIQYDIEFELEQCQTTDILTQNGSGTVLNVLNSQHVFDYFSIKSSTKI